MAQGYVPPDGPPMHPVEPLQDAPPPTLGNSFLGTVMILLALAVATAAHLPGIVGAGNETCLRAMQPDFRDRAFDYITGVWSGLNMAGDTRTGYTVDQHVMLKDVVEACMAQPKTPLALAVLAIHMRYEKQGR